MRFAAIAFLSCQQFLALSLVYAVIPVVLRQQGASLEAIGAFGLVFFAFTVNFLWAPIVDRTGLKRLGRRRSWIVAMQAASALLVATLALRDPGAALSPILAISVALAAVAATQRIATLGYTAEVVGPNERAWGATALGWGSALGNVLGGALGLFLVEAIGWQAALLSLAGLMLVFGLALLLLREPKPVVQDRQVSKPGLFAILRQASAWQAILVIAPATFGVAVAFAMAQPRLVDLGFALTAIGAVSAAANLAATTLVGPLAGALASRTQPLHAIATGAVVLAGVFAVFSGLSGAVETSVIALAGVGLVFCALATQNIVFNTLFFSLSKSGDTATDITFLTACMSIIALLGFFASGFVASHFGYTATYVFAAAGYGVTAIVAALLLRYGRAADHPTP